MTNTKITYNRIWLVAYPIILGSIAQNIINFTDTAFLGRVGEIALGAGAIGGLFYLAVIMLGLGFGTGAQIIIARRLGEGKFKDIGEIVIHTIIFLTFLAILIFILLKYVSVDLLRFSIDSTAIYTDSIAFLDIRAYGIFFAFINMAFRSFYVGIAKTKVITYTTLVLAAVNIFLDYGLIFGNLGMPEMGIRGAALASVVAEISAMIFFVIYTLTIIDYKKYDLFCFARFRLEKLAKIFGVSIPMMIQQFVSLSVWFVFFLFVEKIGEMALAVSNIIRSVYVIAMIPIWGFAATTNTLVSYLIGQKRQDEVFSLIYRITLMSFCGVLIIVSFGLFFPRMIIEIYTNQKELIDMGAPVLYIVNIGALFLSVGFVLLNSVSGTGKTTISLSIEIIVLLIYVSYIYVLIFVFKTDVFGAWTSELVYGFLLSIASWGYLKSKHWLKSKI
ncbi:MAG TPA: MATE family efflux transporter [Bacteroidales bacterium]|nr:MATE family efflux transporter [Bacteroidota bacterium]HJN06441.1 MATE family efflux transporter [Bacteroidales bacterium]